MFDALAVFVGGGAGSVARWLISLAPFGSTADAGFPVATFVTNVIGAFCIGFIVGLAVPASLPPKTTLLLKTGFCGGFTTFSTFALEASGLFERGNWFVGGGYVLLSLVLGVLACFAGQLVAGGLCPRV